MKFFKYLIQAIFIYFFIITIKLLGLNFSKKIFIFIFRSFGNFFRSKKIIINNLGLINKTLSEKDKIVIINNMWKNYASTFVEYFFLNKYRKNNDHISIKGEDKLKSLKDKKEQVIFISGHFSNFELMSMELTKRKIDIATIYRPLNNYFLNPIMEYYRRKYVCNTQIKKGLPGVKDAIRHFKNGKSIALMVDQRVSEGESLPFFNKQALTTTLPAQLALRFKCNIIPIYLTRNENKFEMEILDPIIITDFNVSKNDEENKRKLSLKINAIMEKLVLRKPSEWILTHNRWK